MEDQHGPEPRRAGYIYKATANSELVVRRMLHLTDEGWYTFHDYDKNPSERKAWYLDRRCHLSPENAADIVQPQRKLERQPGTWTITATALGSGKEVSLHLFTVVWPSSWFQKGYSTFTMGCESLEEARAWHGAVAASISNLRRLNPQKRASSVTSDVAYQVTWAGATYALGKCMAHAMVACMHLGTGSRDHFMLIADPS